MDVDPQAVPGSELTQARNNCASPLGKRAHGPRTESGQVFSFGYIGHDCAETLQPIPVDGLPNIHYHDFVVQQHLEGEAGRAVRLVCQQEGFLTFGPSRTGLPQMRVADAFAVRRL